MHTKLQSLGVPPSYIWTQVLFLAPSSIIMNHLRTSGAIKNAKYDELDSSSIKQGIQLAF